MSLQKKISNQIYRRSEETTHSPVSARFAVKGTRLCEREMPWRAVALWKASNQEST